MADHVDLREAVVDALFRGGLGDYSHDRADEYKMADEVLAFLREHREDVLHALYGENEPAVREFPAMGSTATRGAVPNIQGGVVSGGEQPTLRDQIADALTPFVRPREWADEVAEAVAAIPGLRIVPDGSIVIPRNQCREGWQVTTNIVGPAFEKWLVYDCEPDPLTGTIARQKLSWRRVLVFEEPA